MPLFLTAYDTLACSGYKLDTIKMGLDRAFIDGDAFAEEDSPEVYRLYSHEIEDVPMFLHPLMTRYKLNETIVIDLRAYTKKDPATGKYVFRQTNESILQLNRALLNARWLKDEPSVFLNTSPLPMIIFSSIVSESIARRFLLNPNEQLTLAVYSAYYYYCLFTDNKEFDQEDRSRIYSAISRNLRTSAIDVERILDSVTEVLSGVKDFCDHLYDVVGNVRLRNFNTVLLFQILGGLWFGINSRETIAVALEHPPTWLALIESAYSDRTYRNTILAKTAERKTSKQGAQDFIRAINTLIAIN